MTKARTNADNVTADIAGITAGTGITGGGTSGTVTITNDMATTIAAAGDLIYGTANDAYAALSLGTAGQFLAVNSGATAPEWVAAPTASANWSLLNAGGTALTGSTTITVSGISNKDKIMILVAGASANAQSIIGIRLNADSGNNYGYQGLGMEVNSTYSGTMFFQKTETGDSRIRLGYLAQDTSSTISGYVLLSGCNTAGVKIFNSVGGVNTGNYAGAQNNIIGGVYNSSSVISSISVISSSGNFDAGTVYVYTSA